MAPIRLPRRQFGKKPAGCKQHLHAQHLGIQYAAAHSHDPGWPHQLHINVNRTIDRRAETFYAGDFDSQVRRHTYPAGIFKDVPAAEMLKINKPIYFQRNIENIVAMAQARGIEVILPTFAASALFLARLLTSSVTAANFSPLSLARAASTAALRARRLV